MVEQNADGEMTLVIEEEFASPLPAEEPAVPSASESFPAFPSTHGTPDEVEFVGGAAPPQPPVHDDHFGSGSLLSEYLSPRAMLALAFVAGVVIVVSILLCMHPWKTPYHAPAHARPIILDAPVTTDEGE
jgi:hypothetical protein